MCTRLRDRSGRPRARQPGPLTSAAPADWTDKAVRVDLPRLLAAYHRAHRGDLHAGALSEADAAGIAALRQALGLVREAKAGFLTEGDQRRYAKSLVLEVRILEDLREDAEALQVSRLRDRAVSASVWSRPSGAAFITGR
jgi:hypothetical protein